jgi:hypothetical protein
LIEEDHARVAQENGKADDDELSAHRRSGKFSYAARS